MTRRLTLLVLAALLGLGACGDSGDGSPGDAAAPDDVTDAGAPACPTGQPEDGAACAPGAALCTYFIQTCACGPSDLEWTCTCGAGGWSCSRSFDCYPCGDGGP